MQIQQRIFEVLKKGIALVSNYKKIILIVSGGALLVAVAVTVYLQIQNRIERKVSSQVNPLHMEYLQLQQKSERSLSDNVRLGDIRGSLYDIYTKNSSSLNGRRALFVAAQIYQQEGEFARAAEYYALVKSRRSYYLAPQAALFEAFCYEDLGEYQKAVDVLQDVSTRYADHFVYGEVMLALARNYQLLNNIDQATKIYQDLSEKQDLGEYASAADLQLKILAVQYGGQQAPVAPVGEQPPQFFIPPR
jgi:tetratricopeptide (TPR) repeat protein